MQDAFAAYSEGLGKTLANLQSLEFLLRLFLHNTQHPEPKWLEKGPTEMVVGDIVAETPLTDWSSLGVLIDRYNGAVGEQSPLKVSRSVVDLRDALAHGRMFMPSMDEPPVLIRFEKPSGGRTRVIFRASAAEWLYQALQDVHAETAKVQAALNEGRAAQQRDEADEARDE